MEKKNSKKKTMIAITIAMLALASMACFCGGISDIFSEISSQLQSGGGSSGGVVDNNLPVYDGGDGYRTNVLMEVGIGSATAGYIADMDEAHNYLFNATSGMTYTVSVAGGADGTDTRITLLDPNGNYVDSADDVSDYDPILTFTANMSGLYTARIDTYSEGSYTIFVE